MRNSIFNYSLGGKKLLMMFVSAIALTGLPQITFAAANKVVALQQSKTVKGQVKDSHGDPIIGATVMVKGTSNGGITDMDGTYSLMDVPGDAMISISYVGYKTVDIKVTDKSLARVTLKEDTEMLDEVVVVGYGVQKKSDIT